MRDFLVLVFFKALTGITFDSQVVKILFNKRGKYFTAKSLTFSQKLHKRLTKQFLFFEINQTTLRNCVKVSEVPKTFI